MKCGIFCAVEGVVQVRICMSAAVILSLISDRPEYPYNNSLAVGSPTATPSARLRASRHATAPLLRGPRVLRSTSYATTYALQVTPGYARPALSAARRRAALAIHPPPGTPD